MDRSAKNMYDSTENRDPNEMKQMNCVASVPSLLKHVETRHSDTAIGLALRNRSLDCIKVQREKRIEKEKKKKY